MKILSNRVKCLKCGDVIYSAHRHDYKKCSCGNIGVDGGMEYLRRVGNMSDYEELSVSLDDEVYEACKEALEWCDETGRNNLGKLSAIFRALKDTGYLDDK